jgi:molybdenum cofactor biosynthesis protein B
MSVHEHKKHAPHGALKIGVITASDSRTPDNDESGKVIREIFAHAGHDVPYYEILPDVPERICAAIARNLPNLDAIVITGGTGIARRDRTIEAVSSLLDYELPGFGELFRMLSYQEIGSSAMLSRAVGGIRQGKFLAALPGSPSACRLAIEKLIVPELAHMKLLLSQ